MIYFTKEAFKVMKKKFFYLELADKSKAIVHIQDKNKGLAAANKENFNLKYNLYVFIDEDMKENNVYLIGATNKEDIQNKIFRILSKEKMNMIYVPINSKWNILFLTDSEKNKEKYINCKSDESEWPCAVANEKYISFLKTKMRPDRELLSIIKELNKL